MVTRKDILNAWVFLRIRNHSIPDEVLDFIKNAALEKLEPINKDYQAGLKDGIAITIKNLENKFKEILRQC